MHEKSVHTKFEEDLLELSDALFAYAFSRLANREVALDLIQETFRVALEKKETFKGESTLKTWCTSILKYKIIDYWSALKRESDMPVEDCFDEVGHWARGIAIDKSVPEDAFDEQDKLFGINKCMDALPDKYKRLLALKYLNDFHAEAICKDLEISESNFWVMTHRAKLEMRRCLEKLGIR